MAKEYTYRNLILWQRAQSLAYQIIQLTRKLPQTWSNAIIARQIIASATSIGANIAEGHGRYTPGAHSNHLSIAKGSTAETDSWLDMLRRDGLISTEEEHMLHTECIEIMAMLTSKILDLESLNVKSTKRLRESTTTYILNQEPPFPFHAEDYL